MSKTCPEKNPKSKDPSYVCNPKTGNWIKIGGEVYLKLIKDGFFQKTDQKKIAIEPKKSPIPEPKKSPIHEPKKSPIHEPKKSPIPEPNKSPVKIIPKSTDETPPGSPVKIDKASTKIIINTKYISLGGNTIKLKLPYQTALRAFRAMQKLHRREVGGTIFINTAKKFEFATIYSGQGGSVSHPHEGEITYHTHPDSRHNKVYYDPPSFQDIIIQIKEGLKMYMGLTSLSPQISIVFANEGVYVIQITDPQSILDLAKILGIVDLSGILGILDATWKHDYQIYMNDMMAKNINRLNEMNELLGGVTINLHPWPQIIKDRGLDLDIKLQKVTSHTYNPSVIEPTSSPKPFIPHTIKPII